MNDTILEAAIRIRQREDLPTFNRMAFKILNPGIAFLDTWHLDAIAQSLIDTACDDGRRLIIEMPPRTLKSTLVSAAWPAFILGHDPCARIIVASYTETLAETLSVATRRIMNSPSYKALFPGTRLEKQTNLHLTTTKGGMRFATSVGGPVTGFGGQFIIIDDPHSASEAHSQAAREAVHRFYDQSLSSRLDNPATGRVVLVMQRLHEDDLAGHLLSRGGFRELKLQAKATEDRKIATTTGVHIIQPGELLDARRLPERILAEKLQEMGSAVFEAQYQQNPVPAAGNMIGRDWIRYYDQPPLKDQGSLALSIDTASKTDPAHDWSVCTIWREYAGKHYLLELWRDKVDYTGLKRRVIELADRYRGAPILIEDVGSGTPLIQEMRATGYPVVPRKPKGTKIDRLGPAMAMFESGHIFLPRDVPWGATFETELLSFPSGRHDDQVDTVSQYFVWAAERRRSANTDLRWDTAGDQTWEAGSDISDGDIWLPVFGQRSFLG